MFSQKLRKVMEKNIPLSGIGNVSGRRRWGRFEAEEVTLENKVTSE